MTIGAKWGAAARPRFSDVLWHLIGQIAPGELEMQLGHACAASPFSMLQHLRGMGAAPGVLAQWTERGDLAVAGVDLSADGLSWSWGGPTRRLLLGVRDECGELIDVVALASAVRDEWALLTGDGWALGLAALAAAEQARDEAVALAWGTAPRAVRLRCWATPLDWLVHGGSGICVLDWGHHEALPRLRGLGEGVVLDVDPAGREALRGMLAFGGLPRVESARPDMGMVA